MLQQLATETQAHWWVIMSMLFFLGVYAWVALKVLRTPSAAMDDHAQLPLQDGEADANDESAVSRRGA